MSSERILNFLVNDILDFAQMRSGKFRKTMQTFKINESVEEIVDVLKFKAQNMNISVHTEFLNFEKVDLKNYSS